MDHGLKNGGPSSTGRTLWLTGPTDALMLQTANSIRSGGRYQPVMWPIHLWSRVFPGPCGGGLQQHMHGRRQRSSSTWYSCGTQIC